MNNSFEALFLGPKSENSSFFLQTMEWLLNEHIQWRKDFHPEDDHMITEDRQQSYDFRVTQQQMQATLQDLSARLRQSSLPHHSPRHLAHMASDVLMPAVLAYTYAMLYNSNNIAWEGSPATTPLESEVAADLIRLVGYNPQQAFGHLTSGGHAANYEGLWMARNLKSVSYALREVAPELIQHFTERQLLYLSPHQTLELVHQSPDLLDAVRAVSVRTKGVGAYNLGKILVPQSKHFSWGKAAELLGLGLDSLVPVRVTERYRLDIDDLDTKLRVLIDQGEPILAVIGILGTTEEGAVDPIHEIVALRERYEATEDISFYIHVDAAYGGYLQSIFVDSQNEVMPCAKVQQMFAQSQNFSPDLVWPASEVYRSFQALKEVDSVTINPHKLGFVPFQVGGVVFKDQRIRNLISYLAAYIFGDENVENAPFMASYTLEGTKAGATAAAVWAAHRCLPLHADGYGKLLREGVLGAHRFHTKIERLGTLDVDGDLYQIASLVKPDTNIVAYALNKVGNTSLAMMNVLNRAVKDVFCYKSGSIHEYDFILSSTVLSNGEYDDVPLSFLTRFGISQAEWEVEHEVFVLRSTIMNPYIALNYTNDDYLEEFFAALKSALHSINKS